VVNHRERDGSLTWINQPPPPSRLLFRAAQMRWKQAPAGLKDANSSREPPFLLLGLSYMKDLPSERADSPTSELAA
jgi:hypothetical protein